MRIIKFALPLAAVICFGALGIPVEAASSKKSSTSTKSRSASESGSRKKSSTSKKSTKSRKTAKSTKAKSRARGSKGKQKAERTVVETNTAQDWIDELPAVELPEEAGPAEDELLELVPDPAP